MKIVINVQFRGGKDYRSFNAIFNNFSSFFFLSNLSRKCVPTFTEEKLDLVKSFAC